MNVPSESLARQVAALPYRRKAGRLEIMLVTSRETRRWVIPKGWPMKGLKDYNAAKREAFEEAGIKGRIGKKSIGKFDYDKHNADGSFQTIRVKVYPLEVKETLRTWPEKKERTRAWFSMPEGSALVADEGLKTVLGKFASSSKP